RAVVHLPIARHSRSSSGPPERWIAPSTPPPPSSVVLAALTIASTSSVVMSTASASTRTRGGVTIVQGSPRLLSICKRGTTARAAGLSTAILRRLRNETLRHGHPRHPSAADRGPRTRQGAAARH